MKKLLVLIFLSIPLASFAQLSVSAIGGENGYTALRGSFRYQAADNLTIIPMYSYFRNSDREGEPSVSRFGLRAEYQPSKLGFGLEGGFVPRSNGYMNYSVAGDTTYFFIHDNHAALSRLFAKIGTSYTRHEQRDGYFSVYDQTVPLYPYEMDETRVYCSIGATLKPFTLTTSFSKAVNFSEDPVPSVENAWTDIPFFIIIDRGFLDYFWSTQAVFSFFMFDLQGGYVYAKRKGAADTFDSANAGITLRISNVSVTGKMEMTDVSSSDHRLFYSLSAGLNF
ncbi:hypothetical protein Emin_1466 [Elusimicrobium minutum Pei191]|uniref:Outer membrane protein beta-barrel domain-containing protein n=1 Tax=Elusimicrobium minutum (strain Pei191) TaxID=445932 RepID=B2KER8_ELUMP|nr:hypothetical protein [Elusimicrobium minutum]ACC99014.1 hypothetical protein Emin_1466 [Elusimicrobium minutum Pei191]